MIPHAKQYVKIICTKTNALPKFCANCTKNNKSFGNPSFNFVNYLQISVMYLSTLTRGASSDGAFNSALGEETPPSTSWLSPAQGIPARGTLLQRGLYLSFRLLLCKTHLSTRHTHKGRLVRGRRWNELMLCIMKACLSIHATLVAIHCAFGTGAPHSALRIPCRLLGV